MGTYLVGGLLVLLVVLVVRKMIRDKKSGKTCCGGDCKNCKKGRQ